MFRFAWLLLPLVLFGTPPARAAVVRGLFQAEVPVPGMDAASRTTAVQQAMRMVLVKVTGNRNAGASGADADLVKQANNYVQQYRYQGAPPAPGRAGATAGGRELWVEFDPRALEHAVRAAGLPVWGKVRPALLIWLATDQGGQEQLISSDDPSGYADMLKAEAKLRGIPLLFPLLDLQDQMQIKPADVWGGYAGVIKSASQRYAPDAILTGALSGGAQGLWEARWTLYLEGQAASTWSTQGDSAEVVLDEGMDGAADALAARYVPSGAGTETTGAKLVISGVTNVDQYARLQHYLQSLDAVTQLEVRRLDPDSVTLYVVAHGGLPALAQVIALGHVLQPAQDGAAGHYRLLSQ